MKQTTIKELKKGDFFTLRDYGEQEITSRPVWIRGEYDKGSKTFSCFKFDDINQRTEYMESNTAVIVNRYGVFVRLYSTVIYCKVRGREFFSDGGYKTTTTSSRLRALGAKYSTNSKRNECFLRTQRQMLSLYYRGKLGNN